MICVPLKNLQNEEELPMFHISSFTARVSVWAEVFNIDTKPTTTSIDDYSFGPIYSVDSYLLIKPAKLSRLPMFGSAKTKPNC